MDFLPDFFRRWFGVLEGHTSSTAQDHKSDQTSSSSQSFYTADVSSFESPSPKETLPSRKSKRKHNDDAIAEFFAMLAEAVDRDAARSDIQDRLGEHNDVIDVLKQLNEEHTQRVKTLEERTDRAAALATALTSVREDIEHHESLIEAHRRQQGLLKRRLRQSRDQLSELMDQIYRSLEHILHSIDERGTLPDFYDSEGSLRKSVVMPMLLMSSLRCTAACSLEVKAAREVQRESRRKYLRVCNSLRAASSVKSRHLWGQRRAYKLETSCRNTEEYEAERKYQQLREHQILSGSVKSFLVELGLFKVAPSDSETSSSSDGEDSNDSPPASQGISGGNTDINETGSASSKGSDKYRVSDSQRKTRSDGDDQDIGSHDTREAPAMDGIDGFEDDDTEVIEAEEGDDGDDRRASTSNEEHLDVGIKERGEDKRSSKEESSRPEAVQTPQRISEHLKQNRQNLLLQRKHLDIYRTGYNTNLIMHLYAYPKASKETFDATLEAPLDEEIQRMTTALDKIERKYNTCRTAAGEAGIENLPSIQDVVPSEEESIASLRDTKKVAATCRAVNRYRHAIELAKPAGPNGSPGGDKERTGPWSQKTYAALPEVALGERRPGHDSPSLSPDASQQRCQILQDEKEAIERSRRTILAMEDGPRYFQSP